MAQERKTAWATYLKKLGAAVAAGNATEHTHRPALKSLLETSGDDIVATNEPKRVRCGAPDFVVSKGPAPVGYVEAKDIGVSLDAVERSEQFQRYVSTLGNLVLTDYIEFRWYVHGDRRLGARAGRIAANGKVRADAEGVERAGELLSAFLTAEVPIIAGARELARRMAASARLVRDAIQRALGEADGGGPLREQLDGFREVLLRDLNEEQFADMYAQTICYGLFAARCNSGTAKFSREEAAYLLPRTNPFLRRMFGHIAGPELDDRIAWAVDDLAFLLARADVQAIVADFGKRSGREDPVVHFYETFLAAYDPRMREARGVYYTPEPVVSYIVRSVDAILRRDFDLSDGLACSEKMTVREGGRRRDVHRVLILDPAVGTGTFLYEIIGLVRERLWDQRGMWSRYVRDHLLPRMFGFEFLMAPYAVAHMKLGLQLAQGGYDFATDERIRIFLTNTLEEAKELAGLPAFARWLGEEASAAGEVKQRVPVMVVLGNPPYSGHSENRGDWIHGLLDAYKQGCPELRKPAQAKWLSDDYVKFIRFAQWRIEETGYGVLAFVTNHGYLDNPTFRGMRRSLMQTFDEVYLLDLHGNAKKKECAPDGGKDENVFDIQQGVAIGIFVKRTRKQKKFATVRHADLWGPRETLDDGGNLVGGKYHWLWERDVAKTGWKVLPAKAPQHLFVPVDSELEPEYEEGWRLPDIFKPNGDAAPGIVTTHDDFAISWSPDEAATKVEKLLGTDSEQEARALFKLCSQNQWQYERAKRELADGGWRDEIVPILYRPFDIRWTVFNRNVAVHRRERVMKHMLAGANLGLVAVRQQSVQGPWTLVGVADGIIESGFISNKTAEINYLFPLYIYDAEDGQQTLYHNGKRGRSPNLAPDFIRTCAERWKLRFDIEPRGDLKRTFGAEDIFRYIYAVLHSAVYRQRYAGFLRADFARVPVARRVDLVGCDAEKLPTSLRPA
ncbi:MAG: N-6 DNA methylase [Myxococcota bacterium]|nr:N-6 DNA methylase [Myxococcota bacterium]